MAAVFRNKTFLHMVLALALPVGVITVIAGCGEDNQRTSIVRMEMTPHHSHDIPDGFSIVVTWTAEDKPLPKVFLHSESRKDMVGELRSCWTTTVISRAIYDAARKAAKDSGVPIRNGLYDGGGEGWCLVEFDDSQGETFHFTVDWHSNSGVACLRSIATALGEKKGILLEPIIRILLSGATPTTEPATDG